MGNQMRRADPDFHLYVLQVCLGLPPVQLCSHLARLDAAILAARHPASRGACRANHAVVRGGGPAFQSRPARVLFRARLSRLVRQSLGFVRIDGGGGDRHLAPTIRLQRLAGDGKLIAKPDRLCRRLFSGQDLASAENTASGECAITANNARAGPRGMRLPCSQLRMVSTGTPRRLANSSCVKQARRRRSRTTGAVAASAGAAASGMSEAAMTGASGNSRPSLNSTIRPSAFSRRRCILASSCVHCGPQKPQSHLAPRWSRYSAIRVKVRLTILLPPLAGWQTRIRPTGLAGITMSSRFVLMRSCNSSRPVQSRPQATTWLSG